MSPTVVVAPRATVMRKVLTKPRILETRVPAAMIALERALERATRCPVCLVGGGELVDDVFAGYLCDTSFVGEGEFPAEVVDVDPGDIYGFVVGVVFGGETAAGGGEEEVVDGLVDSAAGDVEPVVDGAEGGDDVAADAGFFFDFAGCGLGSGFVAFWVALGEAPFEAAAAVDAGDDGDGEVAVVKVDDDASCGDLF